MHVAISRLLKNMIVFVYLAHVNSCIFWLIETNLTESNRWIDKAQLSKDPNGIPYPFYYRYPRNFYYGQRALFFVFRDVDLLSEIYFAIFEILIGAICYGSIFGNIAAIIRVMDSKAALDQAAEQRNFMLTGLKHHMISNRFPAKLQEKVLQHEEFGWIQRRGVDVEKFFGHLPRTLHHEICLFLYYDLISAVPIFKSTDDSFKLAIATHITTITVPPNFYIFKQGDSGNVS
ncbi:cyclic nucleotide-binding-like protein [Paraphysoderma sedebokerense]|nr:cyclic nucleotide-binding-like protein [Paraphysoderma sedebokerense]